MAFWGFSGSAFSTLRVPSGPPPVLIHMRAYICLTEGWNQSNSGAQHEKEKDIQPRLGPNVFHPLKSLNISLNVQRSLRALPWCLSDTHIQPCHAIMQPLWTRPATRPMVTKPPAQVSTVNRSHRCPTSRLESWTAGFGRHVQLEVQVQSLRNNALRFKDETGVPGVGARGVYPPNLGIWDRSPLGNGYWNGCVSGSCLRCAPASCLGALRITPCRRSASIRIPKSPG